MFFFYGNGDLFLLMEKEIFRKKKTKPSIELGTPQHYHVTMQSIMFSGRKVVGYFSIFLFVVANPFAFRHCLNLTNCRMPISDINMHWRAYL